MAISNRLCNPTPFDVTLPYGSGERIYIPAYGHVEMRHDQVNDFTPGKPGYPNVREMLEFNSLFVFDPDRDYNAQALQAIKRCVKLKEDMYEAGVTNVQNQISAAGVQFTDDNFNKRMEKAGYGRLGRDIEVLKTQIAHFEKVVDPSDVSEAPKPKTYDMTRTVFPVGKPPIEFPTAAAMEFFLSRPENKALKAARKEALKRAAAEEESPTVEA